MSTTRKQRDDQLVFFATQAFDRHQFRPGSVAGCWQLRRIDEDGVRSTAFWVEIVCLFGGRLIVHGDIQPVMFEARAGGTEAIRWAAAAHLDYLAEKVLLRENAHTADVDVAIGDLEEWFRDGPKSEESAEEIQNAIERLRHGDELSNVLHDLHEAGHDSEIISPIGKVIDPRVYYAHGALKRLAALLETGGA